VTQKPESRSAPRTRVCVVAPSLGILGGQAVIAQRLMERLREDPSLEVSFIPHNPQFRRPFHWLQRVKYLRTLTTFPAYVVLLLARLWRVDVVHAFSASYWSFLLAPAPAILIGRLYGKKVILNYRSGEAQDHLQRWKSAAPLMRMASTIVVPSGYLVEVFKAFSLTARPISNFVNVSHIPFRVRDSVRPVFLSNRNFAPLYNVACVLRAFLLIQKEYPNAELTVAGDGEQREMLHHLAEELALRNVRFVGQVQPAEMGALYEASDIYLNSPNIDNMPNSIVEAFAAGLPVVTTRAGGIPYIVTHEKTGLLVDLDDDRGMAAAALRLLRDPQLARAVSIRGRDEVLSRYTWNVVREAWRDVYGAAHHGPTQPADAPLIAVLTDENG
jgi:L-malate glycosyltransferase